MYTHTVEIEKVGEVAIATRHNTGNGKAEFLLLNPDGSIMKDKFNVPHIYHSVSVARVNARIAQRKMS